jgi:hypothetical protein
MILAPYIVLDGNALSRDALLVPAISQARAHGLKLLITDAIMIELLKGDNWEGRLRAGFARISAVPELIAMARSVPELIRMEAQSGTPAHAQIEDPEMRSGIRSLLADSQVGKGRSLDFMRARIEATKTKVLPQYLDGPTNKDKIAKYVELFETQFGGSERRKLSDPMYRREQLAKPVWSKMIARILTSVGFANPATLAFRNSVQVQSIFAEVLIAMRWYRDNGIIDAIAAKLTNDLMDAEYAVIASLCTGFATEDGRSRTMWEDLTSIAQLRAATN